MEISYTSDLDILIREIATFGVNHIRGSDRILHDKKEESEYILRLHRSVVYSLIQMRNVYADLLKNRRLLDDGVLQGQKDSFISELSLNIYYCERGYKTCVETFISCILTSDEYPDIPVIS